MDVDTRFLTNAEFISSSSAYKQENSIPQWQYKFIVNILQSRAEEEIERLKKEGWEEVRQLSRHVTIGGNHYSIHTLRRQEMQ